MMEDTIEITNERGFHARAASKFVHLASSFGASIKLSRGDVTVDGKSILGILLLQAAKGSAVTLQTEGEDEAEAFRQLSAMITSRFGEKN